jgi:hypothetical protein
LDLDFLVFKGSGQNGFGLWDMDILVFKKKKEVD